MAAYHAEYLTDLAKPSRVIQIPHQFAMGDNESHTFSVLVYDSDNPSCGLMDGTVSGIVVRPDGGSVILTGEKGEAAETVTLPDGTTAQATRCTITTLQACFAYAGQITVVIRLVDDETITAVFMGRGPVVPSLTDTPVDPGELIEDITTLIATANQAAEDAEDALEQASAIVSYAEQTGQTDAQKEQARTNIGAGSAADVADLKSAIIYPPTTPTLVTVTGLNIQEDGTKWYAVNGYNVKYVPCVSGKKLTFTITPTRTGAFRFGYSSASPAHNVAATYIDKLSLTNTTPGTFVYTPSADGYFGFGYYADLLGSVVVKEESDQIKEILADLQDEIDNFTIETDKTLSVSDEAADAKVVGDRITTLSGETEYLMDKNRPDDTFELSGFTQGSIYNGVLDANNQKCISTIAYYPLHKAILLSAKIAQSNSDDTSWNVRFTFYNANGEYVGQNGYSVWNGSFMSIIPSTAELMRISISLLNDGSNPNITPSDYTSGRKVNVTLSYYQTYATLEDINAIPQNLTKYYYEGEDLDYRKKRIAFEDYLTLSNITAIQGSAIYGDYLFTANNGMSKIAVTDMKNKTQVDMIEFTAVSNYHCNVLNFGNEKYDSDDDFPLLYISMENAYEHKALVMRIQQSGSTFSATLVQTITYPTNADAGMYYQNCFVDNDGGYLYVIGSSLNDYHSGNGNKLKVKKYNLPLLSAGDVQLANADVLGSFEVDLLTAPQGGFIANGKLIHCCGLGDSSYPDVHICMIDLVNGKMVTNILLNNYGITTEQESAFVWNEGLYIMTNGGKITRVYT